MKFSYQSSIGFNPPSRPGALSGLIKPTSSAQADVMRSLNSVNAANSAVAADKADSDYAVANQRAQQAAVLSGLESLVQDRDRANAYQNAALRGYLSAASPVFSSMMR